MQTSEKSVFRAAGTFRCLVACLTLMASANLALAEIDWDENPGIRGIDPATAPGGYNAQDSRLRQVFGKTGTFESGPDAKILWRRVMGPFGGFTDMAGPVGPAALSLTRKDDHIYVQGGNFRLFWWTTRGGEISDIRLYNGKLWYPLIHHRIVNTIGLVGAPMNELIPVGFRAFRADTMPNFVVESPADFAGNTPLFFLGEDKHAQWKFSQQGDEVQIDVIGEPATFMRQRCGMEVEQTYHIFPQGVILCDLDIRLPKRDADPKKPGSKSTEPLTVREMGMGSTISDSLYSPLYEACRTHFMSRLGKRGSLEHKQFFNTRPHIVLDETFPYFGASTCWPGLGLRTYTNAAEITLENRKGFNGKDMITKPFYVRYDPYSMQFFYSLAWGLYSNPEGKPYIMEPGFSYSNHYVMAFGSHRLGSVDGTPAGMRNNLAAQRIVLWKNSSQQGAAWYPATDDIAKLSAAGMDVLILGKGWMSKPYDIGKVVGSYAPADEAALKRVIDDCHAKNIRVGLSMLGLEYYTLQANSKWISQYLKKDFDGIFVEETSFLAPRAEIYADSVKIGDRELPLGNDETGAYTQFLLTRQLRALVGDKGFLLGASDTGPATSSLACFDAYMPSKAQLDQMNGGLDQFVYFSFLNSCGSVLPAEANQALVATGAGLGCSFARTIEGRNDVAADFAVKALWTQLGALDRTQVSIYNGMTEDSGMIRSTGAGACLLVNAQGKCMVVAGNNGASAGTANVTLDNKKLKINTATKAVSVGPRGVSAVSVD